MRVRSDRVAEAQHMCGDGSDENNKKSWTIRRAQKKTENGTAYYRVINVFAIEVSFLVLSWRPGELS